MSVLTVTFVLADAVLMAIFCICLVGGSCEESPGYKSVEGGAAAGPPGAGVAPGYPG